MGVVKPGVAPPRWELYAGMPCWIELISPEPQRAAEFYAGLFGWTFAEHTAPDAGEHLIAHRQGFAVASIRSCPPGKAARWRLFLATGDLAETVARAEAHGATTTVPPVAVSGVGTKTVLMSPADAEFGLLEPEPSWEFDVGLPGTLMWPELVAIKAQTADVFFHDLFDYEAEEFGSQQGYSVWFLGEESVMARVSMVREHIGPETRPHWLIYLGADPEVGVDELVRRAVGLDGRVRVVPYDSSLGRVAVLRDPTGARFALVDHTQAGEAGTAANYDPYED
ncbi:VOC family protein [Allosaccharopolyspora coralli]|uniref:VOC family protein n=1 Tax=Allosaccharopolyspora coralli TaxID=2665642 RepID=A0A5Q3Q7H7_9PSEU|nr:VOC family protein [Allosaccharopolyspora coralli]QGK69780.1 VOC family protein [Allosaccharopolyspora coralli]